MPVRELPAGGQWPYEAKLDGYRCLVAKRGATVVLWSRRGTGFTDRFPAIARACEPLPPETLIDAEVIVVDENGRCSFNALQHKRPPGHIQLYAFDLLVHRGRNAMRLPIEERRQLLTDALRYVRYPVIQSGPFDVKPTNLLRAAKQLEMEGVIAKRKGSRTWEAQRHMAQIQAKSGAGVCDRRLYDGRESVRCSHCGLLQEWQAQIRRQSQSGICTA
jgi:bifunctional non-homologous end joining protein LigD